MKIVWGFALVTLLLFTGCSTEYKNNLTIVQNSTTIGTEISDLINNNAEEQNQQNNETPPDSSDDDKPGEPDDDKPDSPPVPSGDPVPPTPEPDPQTPEEELNSTKYIINSIMLCQNQFPPDYFVINNFVVNSLIVGINTNPQNSEKYTFFNVTGYSQQVCSLNNICRFELIDSSIYEIVTTTSDILTASVTLEIASNSDLPDIAVSNTFLLNIEKDNTSSFAKLHIPYQVEDIVVGYFVITVTLDII